MGGNMDYRLLCMKIRIIIEFPKLKIYGLIGLSKLTRLYGLMVCSGKFRLDLSRVEKINLLNLDNVIVMHASSTSVHLYDYNKESYVFDKPVLVLDENITSAMKTFFSVINK